MCITCRKKATGRQLIPWLRTHCKSHPLFSKASNNPHNTFRQGGSINQLLQVGYRFLHTSHKLATLGGIAICTTCGNYTASKPRKLGERCKPRTVHGKRALNIMNQGKPPYSIKQFPIPITPHDTQQFNHTYHLHQPPSHSSRTSSTNSHFST